MTRTVLALILTMTFVPLYLIGNLLLVAWIRRRGRGWFRAAKLFALRQVRPLTATRIRITSLGHVLAFAVLAIGLKQHLEIVELALLLLAYVAVVAALALSLLAQMPVFKRVWSDVFARILLLGAPVVFAYLTKGYSQMWLDETLTFGSDNAPMARIAGIIMMGGLGAAIFFLMFAILFEFAVIFIPLLPARRRGEVSSPVATPKASVRSMLWALFSSKLDVRSPEHREWTGTARSLGMVTLFACSFLGCLSAVQASLAPFRSGFGKVVLATIAFDFDAAPAGHCGLNKDERRDADGDQPKLKALMLSTSQEKAILLTRAPHLFDPVLLSVLGKETDRKLTVGRQVSCFAVPQAASGDN